MIGSQYLPVNDVQLNNLLTGEQTNKQTRTTTETQSHFFTHEHKKKKNNGNKNRINKNQEIRKENTLNCQREWKMRRKHETNNLTDGNTGRRGREKKKRVRVMTRANRSHGEEGKKMKVTSTGRK